MYARWMVYSIAADEHAAFEARIIIKVVDLCENQLCEDTGRLALHHYHWSQVMQVCDCID
jgi:hypothetical protein